MKPQARGFQPEKRILWDGLQPQVTVKINVSIQIRSFDACTIPLTGEDWCSNSPGWTSQSNILALLVGKFEYKKTPKLGQPTIIKRFSHSAGSLQ